MKLTKNFYLREFIDPETFKQYGDKSIWFIDPRIANIAQKLRDRLGIALYVNTWHMGGVFKYSGFRPPACPVGASKSQHKFGRAIDVKTLENKESGADMIRQEIINNFYTYHNLGVTTIESEEFAPTWCHVDLRFNKSKNLLIIKP